MTHFSWDRLEPFLVTWSTTASVTLLRLILLLIVGWVAWRAIRKALQRFEAVLSYTEDRSPAVQAATTQRAKTLTGLLRTIASVGIWLLVAVIGLDQMGLQIGPILAGAGVAGLAIGFGAQYLVRDLITGFFMVMEDQIRLGDDVVINAVSGRVESISFRAVLLRDACGVVHMFPNGSINTLANMTKDWSACIISVGIGYEEDTDRVTSVMRQVHQTMKDDEGFNSKMLGEIEVFGIDEFGDSAVTLKARIKTRPGQQAGIGREYRRRLKYEFDKVGIDFPYPQRTVHIQGEGAARAA